MTDYLNGAITSYVADLRNKSRDFGGLSLAMFFLGIAGYVIYIAFTVTLWWIILAAPFGLFGLVGFVSSIQKKDRNNGQDAPSVDAQ
jgi:hypothetical protein